MKIMILCSKHFYEKTPPIRNFLETNGHFLKMPNSFDEPFAEERFKKMSKEAHINWKSQMIKQHEPNISAQDAVLVLNFEKNGIKNYIRGATFLEVYMAWRLNKKIFFYNPLPNCSFTDELTAFNPKILNRDLTEIC